MARTKEAKPAQTDRRDKPLPITEEVGSEGGSYAEATYQVATFGDETEPQTVEETDIPTVLGESIDFASVRGGGVGTAPDPHAGMLRYPTEPPAPPSAREGRRARPRWQSLGAGALAAAAGAALVLRLLRNRRSSFVPERDEGINPGRAPGRDIAGRQRDCREE